MNKKGISPLIATIFLIAVAVALGSIVMSLGQEYVTRASSGVAAPICTELNFEVKAIRYAPSTNSLRISFDNKGSQIDGFLLKVFNQDFSELTTERIETPLEAYNVGVVEVVLDRSEISRVYEIVIVPLENSGNDAIACDELSKTFTYNSPIFRVEE